MAKHPLEQAQFFTMVMVKDGNQVLVLDRKKQDWPGITFPGGHVEPGEVITAAAIREVAEETGLEINNLKLSGICQYEDEKTDQKFRRVIFFYQTDSFTGTLKSSREGEVFWLSRTDLDQGEVAGELREFIKIFDNDEIFELYYSKDPNVYTDYEIIYF